MRIRVLFLLILLQVIGCTSGGKQHTASSDSRTITADRAGSIKESTVIPPTGSCEVSESLVYDNGGFSTYTEDVMRGAGVVSFQLNVNDRLDIYYPDDAIFGYLVFNEDQTFYTTSMPKKLIARWVVPEADFARFDFDAEAIDTNDEFLIIYANKQKLKVNKAGVKYSFKSWPEYICSQTITLKDWNTLKEASGVKDLTFDITECNSDRIRIKSSKDCAGEDAAYKPVEGWLPWRKNGKLLVNLSDCI